MALPPGFTIPTALDPDLANILAAYLSSRNANLAGYDTNQADLTTQFNTGKVNLGREREVDTGRLNASLADRGVGQSGIALAALAKLAQDYETRDTQMTQGYNTNLSDLATKRIAANQLYGQQETGLWSQNTERAAAQYQKQQEEAAALARAQAEKDAATALTNQQAAALQPAAAPEPEPQEEYYQPPQQTYRAPRPVAKPAPPKPTPKKLTGSIGASFGAGLGAKAPAPKPLTKRYGPQ